MNNRISCVAFFIIGCGLGTGVSLYFFKTKFEKIMDEEVKKVKEEYSEYLKKRHEKKENSKQESQESVEDSNKKEKVVKNKIINNHVINNTPKKELKNYTKYSETDKEQDKKSKGVEKPYIIEPDEAGEFEDYELITIYYYPDESTADEIVLTDDCDEVLDRITDIIGEEWVDQFGVYEEDSVYIRNDKHKCDYEILKEYGRLT